MIARFLATVLLVCGGLWALDEFGLGKWIEGDRAQIARLQGDLASVKQASDDAVRIQMAASEAIEARYSQLAKESVDAHQIAQTRVQAAVAAYAASHRVRTCTPSRDAIGPGAASVPANPEAPAGDGGDAALVGITRQDLDQLAGAAVQNAERGAFLQSIIDEGLAVPVPGF